MGSTKGSEGKLRTERIRLNLPGGLAASFVQRCLPPRPGKPRGRGPGALDPPDRTSEPVRAAGARFFPRTAATPHDPDRAPPAMAPDRARHPLLCRSTRCHRPALSPSISASQATSKCAQRARPAPHPPPDLPWRRLPKQPFPSCRPRADACIPLPDLAVATRSIRPPPRTSSAAPSAPRLRPRSARRRPRGRALRRTRRPVPRPLPATRRRRHRWPPRRRRRARPPRRRRRPSARSGCATATTAALSSTCAVCAARAAVRCR